MPNVKRLLIDAGHGMNNTGSGYDPGAIGSTGQEHEIVTRIAGGLLYALSPLTIETIAVPDDLSLWEVIAWVNAEYRPGDYLLSIHMNSGPPVARGTEVLYASNAPKIRAKEAAIVSAAVATALRIPNRGPKKDTETPRGFIGLVRKTRCPALLVEVAFVTNPEDVKAARARGVSALAAGVRKLMEVN